MSRKCLVHKVLFLVPSVAAVALLSVSVQALSGSGNMPQQRSADALSVLLGDVRSLIANEMIGKADQYFHGGVTDVQGCSHGHGGEEPPEEHGLPHPDHDEEAEESPEPLFDPWASLKRAVRLPSEDRHIEASDSHELLPWFWAAVKLDPRNAGAYLNAAYVMEVYHNKPQKSLEILDMGLAAVPGDPEICFSKGMLLYRKLGRPADAAIAFRGALDGLSAEPDDDTAVQRVRIYEMLGIIAHRNGDTAALRSCLEKAKAILPAHSCTKYLESLL